jgi:hypothetical protein
MKVDFFIVGAPKSATTSLFHYLGQHEEICMSTVKEPDFFSHKELHKQKLYYKSKPISDINTYHNLFLTKKKSQLLGEASVSYLFYPKVSERIFSYNPNAKIIIILRNPVERTVSHYQMDRRLGFIKDNLADVLNDSTIENHSLYYQQYILLSYYYQQVKNYIDVFGKEKICILNYDDLKKNNKDFTSKVLSFLDLKVSKNINFDSKYNHSKSSRFRLFNFLYSKKFIRKVIKSIVPKKIIASVNEILFDQKLPNLSVDVESQLYDLFKEDIVLLEKMLDINLSSWKK